MEMTLVRDQYYRRIRDIFNFKSDLDRIAGEFESGGWEVERGILHSVILKMDDGEVHYMPNGKAIHEMIFEYDKGGIINV